MRRVLRWCGVLGALLLPVGASAGDAGCVGFGAFYGPGGDDSGIEMSIAMQAGGMFSGKLSGVLYAGLDPLRREKVFQGYALSGFIHLAQGMVEPRIGGGLFGGETFYCAEVDPVTGECIEDVVLAIYPEVGVAFNLWGVQIYPFLRRYYDTYTRGSVANTWGMQIGFGL